MPLAEIADRQFDVATIGGGIIGAGIARDAALRGLSVVLFEQNDFGSGTTAGSTRLIHGGLRYLEQLDFDLVKMDLKERAILLRIAPHLVKPLPFILPFYDSNLITRAKFGIGLSLYDWFAGRDNLERHRSLNANEVIALEPHLRTDGLQGGALFFDAQVNSPERLCLANILDAEAAGAKVFNYCRVEGAVRENGKIAGVIATDWRGRFPIRAKLTVNASGPWFDRVAGLLQADVNQKIRTTKGVHIACSPTLSKHAVIFKSHLDGRTMFIIPWLGSTWIGTTDTDFEGDPGTAHATSEDLRYLHDSAAAIVPALRDTDIYFSNTGVRALVLAGGSESAVSRKHRIDTPIPGLISVLGGKITGYRAIAEEVTDILADNLKINEACQTADKVLPIAPNLELEEQIRYSVEKEHCRTLSDFVFRRTTLGFSPDQARSIIESIATALGKALNWTDEQINNELREYFVARRFQTASETTSIEV